MGTLSSPRLHAIQVISILGGSFEAIEALEREGLVRVHTDIGVVCGVIKGSFPTADAALDPTRNSLELALRLDDAIRYDLSDVVPTIVTDESVTKLRVANVMDPVEERPMNLIHGQRFFRVAGFNMVLSDEGATAYLQNALGTTFPLVIDEIVSKQLFKAHTAELPLSATVSPKRSTSRSRAWWFRNGSARRLALPAGAPPNGGVPSLSCQFLTGNPNAK